MSYRRFCLTIPHANFLPYLPPTLSYIRGQLENSDSGFLHWQLYIEAKKKSRFSAIKNIFGDTCHVESTIDVSASLDYVWKEETRVDGTSFELGQRRIDRADPKDWEAIRTAAKTGRLDDIPPDIYVRCYNSFIRIKQNHLRADFIERSIFVYWGATGTGKSRRAWELAGSSAYPKDPLSKFWDGYNGQEHVVIDEFRGVVSISHVLRWFDRYPVLVEVKGSSVPLCAKYIWVTSNLDPRNWYPELDQSTKSALLRRLTITEFPFAAS